MKEDETFRKARVTMSRRVSGYSQPYDPTTMRFAMHLAKEQGKNYHLNPQAWIDLAEYTAFTLPGWIAALKVAGMKIVEIPTDEQ